MMKFIRAKNVFQLISLIHFFVIPLLANDTASSTNTFSKSKIYQNICMPCHGTSACGNQQIGTPPLAGLPTWYLRVQLEKMKSGIRGGDSNDTEGHLMYKAIQPLTPSQVTEAILTISQFPALPKKNKVQGDLRNGEYLYKTSCIDCHRYNGMGDLFFKSSPLALLLDWYLRKQILKFRDKTRGSHIEDKHGTRMQLEVSHLKTEKDILDILAYINGLNKTFLE